MEQFDVEVVWWSSLEPLLLVSECTLQAVLKFEANDSMRQRGRVLMAI